MKFYKYRSLDRHTEKIFTHYQMYFPKPLECNDPFDCRVPVSFSDGTKVQYRELLEKILPIASEQQGLSLTADQLKKTVEHHLQSENLEQIVTGIEKGIIHEVLNNNGIFCMSEKNDDILMWSHYAGNHSGFCLEIPHDGIFKMAKKVIYSESFPNINYFESTEDELREGVLLTKAASWSYEKEWRILQRNITPGVHSFEKPNFLTGVIFGLWMTDENKQKIRKWAKQGNHEVKFYQIQKREGAFGFDVSLIQ